MQDKGFRKYLSKRLFPGAVAVAILISLVFPATYYVLQVRSLEESAALHAYAFSEKIKEVIGNNPILWKYQTQKYLQATHEISAYQNVLHIHLLDEKGEVITGSDFERVGDNVHESPLYYFIKADAPLIYNNRKIGRVEVYLSRRPVLKATFIFFLLSLTTGVTLSLFTYRLPVKVAGEADEELSILLAGLENKVAERTGELKKSEENLRAHIDNSFDVIFTLNAEGRFMFVSAAWERHFGYPVSAVLGESFLPFVHPNDAALCQEHLQDVVGTMQPATSPPYRVKHADGSWRIFMSNGMPYLDLNGEVLYNGVGHDITESKQAEEEIRRLNEYLRWHIAELEEARVLAEAGVKVRDEFLANITHELVTPLNAIIGFSQVLLDGLSGTLNDKQQGYAQAILQSGERLNETYGAILQVAGLESGEMPLQVKPFLLKELLESSLRAHGEKAAQQGVTLSLEIGPPPETEIEADRGKLQQVMFNLLRNAVKFTPAGGSVRVAARLVRGSMSDVPGFENNVEHRTSEIETDVDFLEISVADTGIGIKEEDMARLFKPFQQLEAVYTKKYSGTGLGLLLAKKLVELHGGSIRVESEFGNGSTFTFVIPVRQTGDKSCHL